MRVILACIVVFGVASRCNAVVFSHSQFRRCPIKERSIVKMFARLLLNFFSCQRTKIWLTGRSSKLESHRRNSRSTSTTTMAISRSWRTAPSIDCELLHNFEIFRLSPSTVRVSQVWKHVASTATRELRWQFAIRPSRPGAFVQVDINVRVIWVWASCRSLKTLSTKASKVAGHCLGIFEKPVYTVYATSRDAIITYGGMCFIK